ncbi:MAG TPA: DUF4199 domain-containing protein, partial [Chitinophagaceae bacterium]|nr:DUF4199 domain-containing protein [Chitinophagaceae bacterium]
VGIKTYRDKHNNGLISFGKAFRIGLYISLIASTMYVIGWVITYFNFIPDFDEKYTEHVLNAMREKGESQEAIERQSRDMAAMWENYQNPFFCAMITYTEILPVGLLISLIAALILKRKVARAEVATP